MPANVLPVIFRGLVWGHPGKPGGAVRTVQTPEQVMQRYQKALEGLDVLPPLLIEGPHEIGRLMNAAETADLVLVIRPELLSCTWAAKALEEVGKPSVLYAWENQPGAVLCDVYGYLRAAGANATLALSPADIHAAAHAAGTKKRLSQTRMLVIGDGFPSWSQVANPSGPEIVKERLGVDTVELDIERLFDEYEKADRAAAEPIAKEWLEGAKEVAEGARQDVVEVARVHLALEKLLGETNAQAITIDCRLWDEENVERFGRFYSPCMPFTIFRWQGIPAACEADVNALLSMLILGYLADRPTFMGNVGRVSLEEGWVDIAHCAATLNMDGIGATPEPYLMLDYHKRGTGIATHSDMKVGQVVTVARLDKDLRNISAIAGPILECEPGPGCLNRIRVKTDNVFDYMHNCLTGDHQAVVYGDVRPELRLLGRQVGLGVVEPKALT